MKIIVFITDYILVDGIVDDPKLEFFADRLPPLYVLEQVALITTEASVEYL